MCHRGFKAIAALLVRAGADVAHIPDAKASCGAHIMRGAPQSALGAAARGGFQTVTATVALLNRSTSQTYASVKR